ncbi:ATP-binding protein, partial [Blautia pseudococcoides]|nr:ATP-binding protein [Blautia pseudococcoides]
TLYIEVRIEEKYLVISIIDEGIGFSREALRYAQDKFFMDDHSRSSRMHFGMGLYITESIMKQHGGCLVLENSLQTHGAKVSMKLPCD